jgi:hypothetical protein
MPAPVQPPVWPSSRPSSSPGQLVAILVFVVVAAMVAVGVLTMPGFSMLGAFAYIPVLMFFLVIVVIVIAIAVSAGGFGRRALPPPPPIQQPMVPAGMQGPIALNCPNCGAPPGAVDRFGVATCTHCATRFLVR